jgi:hypothetical protein
VIAAACTRTTTSAAPARGAATASRLRLPPSCRRTALTGRSIDFAALELLGRRRGTLVRLTRKGKALIDGAVARHVANEEALLRGLTPERRSLDGLLPKLLACLPPHDAPCRSLRPW